jgi:hypothetical protein
MQPADMRMAATLREGDMRCDDACEAPRNFRASLLGLGVGMSWKGAGNINESDDR